MTDKNRAEVLKGAGILSVGTLLSRVLGLGRDIALAALFRRQDTDIFFVAFTIPNTFRQLLGEGAMSSAVVPLLAQKMTREGEHATRFVYARFKGFFIFALAVTTAGGMLFAEPLCELFASGYHDYGSQFERTVTMTRFVFPYLFLMGISLLDASALQVKRSFIASALAPSWLNISFLLTAFLLPPWLHARGLDPAYAMGTGALLGGVLQVVCQWPSLRQLGFWVKPVLDFREPTIALFFRRIGPMLIGVGVYYVDVLFSRRFLSELGIGAPSYFMWAMRICDLPQAVFGMALTSASLPMMATLVSSGQLSQLVHLFSSNLRLVLSVAIPASVMLVVLAEPFTAALFQRGQFDQVAMHETARALAWQGGGLWMVVVVRQVIPLFHALEDTKTPILISALDFLVFFGLASLLKGPMGHCGVSAAVVGASLFQMVFLCLCLGVRFKQFPWKEVIHSALRILQASAVAGGGAWGICCWVSAKIPSTWTILHAIIGVGLFGLLFLGACWLLGVSELTPVARMLMRRIPFLSIRSSPFHDR
ncbi:murein biosynthesis integral membrane protein MurJ [Pajaroellobacter abortibovis]|uniref:Probable lipid II flippase MurJ n=1 Tax=Pajaroellobacter abortibovis TaxID=1882918 RepID=A0A1L6MXW3_9BACT|nr:murein biosynthesis integral membrane protein MurJ [Pajaroellobacter abortibovis]APS00316.1 murein biosynthesis integral membrane protein MurJ [Pajaroellobacter abortibovis]